MYFNPHFVDENRIFLPKNTTGNKKNDKFIFGQHKTTSLFEIKTSWIYFLIAEVTMKKYK